MRHAKWLVVVAGIVFGSFGVLFVRAGRKDPPAIHRADSDRDLRFGVGVWIVNLAQTEHGNVRAMAAKARHFGLSHVVIKTANSDHWYRFNHKKDVLRAIEAFHAQGVRVYGFNYIYGRNKEGERKMASEVLKTDVDGVIFDVEAEYSRTPNNRSAALLLCRDVRELRDAVYPGKVLAYSTFCRIDEKHVHWRNTLPLDIFGRYMDYAMPQAYWKDWRRWTPERAIRTMLNEWGGMYDDWRATGKGECCKPIIPTGHAYDHGHGTKYIPPAEVARFKKATASFQGTNWWRWDYMGEAHWEAIRAVTYGTSIVPSYRPIRPTGREWPLVTLVRVLLWLWLLGGVAAFLAVRLYWRYYRRLDDCLAYAILWPYTLALKALGRLVELRYMLVR